MRVVDRDTFLKLPAGTIYAKIPEPIIIRELSVKADSMSADWVMMHLANWQAHDSGEWADRYYQMLEGNVSVPCDDMFGRDGMFDMNDKFLIFERDDLLALRGHINEALKLPDLPTPSRTLKRID